MKPDTLSNEETRQLNTKSPQGNHLETVYRALLRIVAYLDETGYTEDNSGNNRHQAEVYHHSGLVDPASDDRTSQG